MSGSTPSGATAVNRASSPECLLNESWGVPEIATEAAQQDFATALYHLTQGLDPTGR